MRRRFTLDEFLDTFAKEETESLPDAISVRVSDAQVRRLGLVFLDLMGGVLECLRKPPRRRASVPSSKFKKDRGLKDHLIARGTNEEDKHGENIIQITQNSRKSHEHKR